MVVRDNDTWEKVSQRLSRPFTPDQCYRFSIYLARSLMYVSLSRSSSTTANYITPTKLRIWAGYGPCDKRAFLAESPLIEHESWREYNFKLKPDAAYTHIVIEVFYQTPTLFPYNGNILVDNASDITPMNCDDDVDDLPADEPALAVKSPTPPNTTPIRRKPPADPDPAITDPPAPTGPKTIFGVTKEELVAGLTVPIDKVNFEANSAKLLPSSQESLEELREFLDDNPNVIVEIGGHTNALADRDFADMLSENRAKAVVDYLKGRGIEPIQLQYQGYGKRRQIATNDTEEGRRKNQRVEVKILAIIKR
jgi:outer membrane protein OmpA-like peptidoglycan-associated protein